MGKTRFCRKNTIRKHNTYVQYFVFNHDHIIFDYNIIYIIYSLAVKRIRPTAKDVLTKVRGIMTLGCPVEITRVA